MRVDHLCIVLGVVSAVLYSVNSEIMQSDGGEQLGPFLVIWFVHTVSIVILPVGLYIAYKNGDADLHPMEAEFTK
ncbi:hypothetical protein KIPB_012026, partial [Kipferlia bialata]|eukprot:g12026.t1